MKNWYRKLINAQGGINLSSNSNTTNGLVFDNHFVKVIKDIMSSTLDLNLSAEPVNSEAEKKHPSFVTGMMVLQGKRDIVLTLTFSKMAAAKIVVSLLGIKYTQLTQVGVCDAVMEITNMVSGRFKTALVSTGEQYQLTTPFVFVGPNHFLEPQTRPNGMVKKFIDRNFEMLAGVFFL